MSVLLFIAPVLALRSRAPRRCCLRRVTRVGHDRFGRCAPEVFGSRRARACARRSRRTASLRSTGALCAVRCRPAPWRCRWTARAARVVPESRTWMPPTPARIPAPAIVAIARVPALPASPTLAVLVLAVPCAIACACERARKALGSLAYVGSVRACSLLPGGRLRVQHVVAMLVPFASPPSVRVRLRARVGTCASWVGLPRAGALGCVPAAPTLRARACEDCAGSVGACFHPGLDWLMASYGLFTLAWRQPARGSERAPAVQSRAPWRTAGARSGDRDSRSAPPGRRTESKSTPEGAIWAETGLLYCA